MSNNPLRVSLENIIPLTEARDHFSQIVNEVQKDKLYVLTKGGKPAVAIIDVKYLEQITGGNVNSDHVETEIQKNPAKVGRVEMISHAEKPTTPPPPARNASSIADAGGPPISKPMPMPKPPTFNPTPATTPTPTPIIPKPTPPPMPTPKPPTPTPAVMPPPPPVNNLSTPTSTPTPPPTTTPNTPPPPPPAAPAAQMETLSPTASLTPIKPGEGPKAVATIEMHPMADIDDQKKDSASQSDNDSTSPDDKPNPAQYSAASANNEPDDMAID